MELQPVDFTPEPEYPVIREHFWKRPCFKKKLVLALGSLVALGCVVAAGVETVVAVDRLMAPKSVLRAPVIWPVMIRKRGALRQLVPPKNPLSTSAANASKVDIDTLGKE